MTQFFVPLSVGGIQELQATAALNGVYVCV